MNFKIPFTISPVDKLRKRSKVFNKYVRHRKKSRLQDYLRNSGINFTREEYISVCIRSLINSLFIFYLISTTILVLLKSPSPFLLGLGISIMFSGFLLFSQLSYPHIYSVRKERNIERNLIAALEDMLIQLNAGIPLFNILVNISSSDYGELSKEFSKAVKKINAGLPQVDVLEDLGEKNPSLYFRRTLWQISNGMRAGSDISTIIRGSIKSLNEEQLIQIQNYGNKLNPIIMFYMLISVIIPALSITFLTIISSLVNLPKTMTYMLFIGLFLFVMFVQIMFLGMIKSLRPSLL